MAPNILLSSLKRENWKYLSIYLNFLEMQIQLNDSPSPLCLNLLSFYFPKTFVRLFLIDLSVIITANGQNNRESF